jgi:hypothetical protein
LFKSLSIFFITVSSLLSMTGFANSGSTITSANCTFQLENPTRGNCSSVVIAPGNDTKVNLLLLNQDKLKKPLNAPTFPNLTPRSANHVFFWSDVKTQIINMDEENRRWWHTPSHCVSFEGGTRDYNKAVSINKAIPESEKNLLYQAREILGVMCAYSDSVSTTYPLEAIGINSSQGSMFLSYIKAAAYFYGEAWPQAIEKFSLISDSPDPWIREASLYMIARTQLIQASVSAIDRWGIFLGPDLVDKDLLNKAQISMEFYLLNYPNGRYTSSAVGLLRRLMFLNSDYPALTQEYARLTSATDLSTRNGLTTLEEIDRLSSQLSLTPGTIRLAVNILALMRSGDHNQISKKELESQKQYFSNDPALYSFLLANYAFYVEKDFREVLKLIPDEAQKNSFLPLEFSRQALRGMALSALDDVDVQRFWQDMLNGVDVIYQRPIVELGLTTNYERKDKLTEVFKKGSLIKDSYIRKTRLLYAADYDILRDQAQNDTRPKTEKDLALFILLYKQLTRGRYEDFVIDAQLVPEKANTHNHYISELEPDSKIPVGIFRDGIWSDGYPCPSISITSGQLAFNKSKGTLDSNQKKNSQYAKALLCLGDFYRLNNIDRLLDRQFSKEPSPSKTIRRGNFYSNLINDPSVDSNDKAYALYRVIKCYSPSGNNSCGGESVNQAQRKDWFKLLKGKYGKSKWAKELNYYW